MKRLRHLLCRNYLWEVIDPQQSFWIVRCTQCGYKKEIK